MSNALDFTILGGVKMRYPSKYVLVTDVDTKSLSEMKHYNSELSKKSSICDSNVNSVKIENSVNENMDNSSRENYAKIERQKNNEMFPKSMLESSTIRSLSSIPMPTNACTILPEKAWQDAIMNSAYTNKSNDNFCATKDENGDIGSECKASLWDFTDPFQKVSCVCIK